MKFRKKARFSQRDILIIGLIGFLTLIVLSVLIGADIGISRVLRGGGEFFSAWEGSRAFLFEHSNPYSGAAAYQSQVLVYGRTAEASENPYILTLPFFLLPLFFPFAVISDPNATRGLWMFVSELALIGTALLCLRLIEWEPRRLFLVLFTLLSLFGVSSSLSILEGTPVIILGLDYVLILFAYSIGEDELAGALMVFSLAYWQVGSLFLILMFWKVFNDKRWRVLSGFAMLFVVLLIISLLIYPGWFLPFLTASLAAIRTPFGITASMVISRLAPTNGSLIAQIISLVLVIVLIYEWGAARNSDVRRFIWTACLTLAITPLIGFRTDMSNLVVLFPSLSLIFAATTERWRTGYWLTWILFAIILFLPWGLLLQWLFFQEQRSYDYLFLFYPLVSVAGLYWTRWWFVRPPRTWLDRVHAELN